MEKAKHATRSSGEIGRFLALYFLFMVIFLLLIGFEPLKRIVDLNGLYTAMVVHLTVLMLDPFGVVLGVEGSVIHFKGISLNVLFGCNGLEAFLIYAAAVLAFRAPWRMRAWGIVIGFFILQVLNILRIVALGLVGVYWQSLFYYFHIYVAQGIMIAVALVLFLVYLSYAVRKSANP